MTWAKALTFPARGSHRDRSVIGAAHPAGHQPSVDPPPSVLLRAGLRPRDEAADLRVVPHRHAADLLRGPRQRRAGAGDRPARPRRLVDHPVGRRPLRLFHRRHRGLARRTSTRFEEEQLADFGAVEMREKGMVGAAMGTTALSASGRWWAVPVKAGPVTRFVLIDTEQKTSSVFLERDTIGHPQFCPDDDDLILYAGPLTDRVWVTDRSGAQEPPALPARGPHAVGHPRGLGAGPPHRRLRRLAARHADDRRRPRRGRGRSRYSRPGTRRRTTRASDSSATPISPIAACTSSTLDDDPADEADAAVRRARRRRRASTGAGRFPTTTGRSRSRPRSTPIRIRAFRRTARACCSPPTRPATRRSTR